MKRIFVTAAATLMLMGCKETVTKGPTLADNIEAVNHGAVSADDLGSIVNDEYTGLYGTWTGFVIEEDVPAKAEIDDSGVTESPVALSSDKISINLKSFAEGKVEAQGIIYGQKLLLHGNYKEEGNGFKINLFRGGETNRIHIFNMTLANDRLIGTYAANKTETLKRVELKHNVFKYDSAVMLVGSSELVDWDNPKKEETPKTKSKAKAKKESEDEFEKTVRSRPQYRYTSEEIETVNASTTKLTEAELKNFTKFDLEILRNTIYARHGYAFKKEFLRDLFNNTDWYTAISDNVDSELTALEKQNIALLTRMEKYAEDHYSYFGR